MQNENASKARQRLQLARSVQNESGWVNEPIPQKEGNILYAFALGEECLARSDVPSAL